MAQSAQKMDMWTRVKRFPLFTTRWRIIATIVVLVVIVFLIGRSLVGAKQAPQYQTAQASRGTLVVSVAESGSVAVANRVSISTQTSGTINQLYVKNGDSVTAGEKIADLTLDTNGVAEQAQAYASLLGAQNNLNSAQSKLNSLQATLFQANQAFITDRGITNPTDADKADPKYIEEQATWLQAEADYKDQTNVIAQAQAALNSASLAYNAVSATITAPVAGTISDITIAPGMVISNSQSSTSNSISSQVVASIKHPGTPIITVNLSEIDAIKVKAGDRATITFDALPSKTFTGKVLGIDTTGTVSSGVTSYPATIALDTSEDQILPNMSASAEIITGIKSNVLLVPIGAVQTTNNQSTVRVLKNGQVTTVPVTVGDSSDTQTEIDSGLTSGQTVIIGYVSTGTQSTSSTTSPFSGGLFGGVGGGRSFGGGGGGAVRVRTGGGG